jgi:hypothetical protein
MGIGLRRLNPTGFVPVAISSFISVKKKGNQASFVSKPKERKAGFIYQLKKNIAT